MKFLLLLSLFFSSSAWGQSDKPLFQSAYCKAQETAKYDFQEGKTLISGPAQAFALDLYRLAATKAQNLILSPFSIHAALAMTSAGAGGVTAQELATAMHMKTPPTAAWHKLYGQTAAHVLCPRPYATREFNLANGLFVQQGKALKPAFLAHLKQHYDAEPEVVDFRKNADGARQTINDWVERQTLKKIQDLIKPGLLNADSRLVLANAVYFKERWSAVFKRSDTKDGVFHKSAKVQVKAPMMHEEGTPMDFAYAAMPGFKALRMNMNDRQSSVLLLLPDAVDGLAKVEAGLSSTVLEQTLDSLKGQRVVLTLPKFKVTSELSLKELLAQLGIKQIFERKTADLTGIDGGEDQLFLAHIVHKAYVDLNEEGVEAAAATAAMMAAGSAPPKPTEPVVFKVDHPFLYLIRDDATGAVLFMGRVVDPSAA